MPSLEQRLENLEARVKTLEMWLQEVPSTHIPGPGVYATRDGGKAYVYTIEGQDPEYPVVGEHDNGEVVDTQLWALDGSFVKHCSSDEDILPERKLS